MKAVPIIIIFFTSYIVYGQISKSAVAIQLDILKSKLKLARNDSIRVNLLKELTLSYVRSSPDSAIHYGEQAFELAMNINSKRIAVSVLGFIGDAYHSKGNLPKSLEICLEAIDINDELSGSQENSAGGPAYSTLGDIYTDVGNYRQALSFYSKLLELPSGDNEKLGYAFGHFGRASVYEKMNMLDSALYELGLSEKYFDESPVDIANRNPKIYTVTPNWFNLRSRVYVKQSKIDLALLDLTYTLNLTLKNDEPYYSSNSYNDIASLYANLNSRDSAIYFAKKGLQEATRIS